MIRQIITIDEEKCTGCGLCADACHEHAIEIVNGKAKLISDHYCDGLGDCLPSCPVDAISFEEREALAYDEEAVKALQAQKLAEKKAQSSPCGCPGSQSKTILRTNSPVSSCDTVKNQSQLIQWPVQIKLLPINAPYFENADLLIAADCTAYAYADFHRDFIKGHVTVIGCPKLDMVDYTEKLTEIIRNNNIKSVKVARMQVPCCGGIEHAAKNAIICSGESIPCQVFTISTDGKIL